jgi:hypothetical protein
MLAIEESKVVVTEEGWMVDLIQDVYKSDKTKDKWKFQDIITGLYFIYKPESLFDNLSQEARENEISNRMLKGHWGEYVKDKKIAKLAELYKNIVTTPSIRNLERLKDDLEKIHQHLSEIPMERMDFIDREVDVKLPNGETERVRIKKRFKVSNLEEKQKVYETFYKMHTTYEKLKTIVEKELTSKKVSKGMKRMFDKPVKTPHNV